MVRKLLHFSTLMRVLGAAAFIVLASLKAGSQEISAVGHCVVRKAPIPIGFSCSRVYWFSDAALIGSFRGADGLDLTSKRKLSSGETEPLWNKSLRARILWVSKDGARAISAAARQGVNWEVSSISGTAAEDRVGPMQYPPNIAWAPDGLSWAMMVQTQSGPGVMYLYKLGSSETGPDADFIMKRPSGLLGFLDAGHVLVAPEAEGIGFIDGLSDSKEVVTYQIDAGRSNLTEAGRRTIKVPGWRLGTAKLSPDGRKLCILAMRNRRPTNTEMGLEASIWTLNLTSGAIEQAAVVEIPRTSRSSLVNGEYPASVPSDIIWNDAANAILFKVSGVYWIVELPHNEPIVRPSIAEAYTTTNVALLYTRQMGLSSE